MRYIIHDAIGGDWESFDVNTLKEVEAKVFQFAEHNDYNEDDLNSGDIYVFEISAELSITAKSSLEVSVQRI